MSDAATRRSITPQIKVIDSKEGLVDYIASDESLDSHHEIVRASGWRFNRFAKNAPFVDSHDYWTIGKLLGKVISAEVKNGQLHERVKWAIDVPGCELARLGFDLTEKGYLKAVSVGFMPVSYTYHGCDDFAKACAEMNLKPEIIANLRTIWLEQEQIELSACIIGSNPAALAKAWHARDIKEEQLVACGFGSEAEMEFLIKSGDVYETSDPVTQLRIRRELEAIVTRSTTLSKGKPSPAPSPSTPDGGDAAKRQADEQLAEIKRGLAEIHERTARALASLQA